MADSNHPSANIQYDPLPLTHDDGGHDQLYNNNNESTAAFSTPMMEPTDLPMGTGQPRFIGRALYDEPMVGSSRPESYAASTTQTIESGRNSSVYALNAEPGAPYRDDPRDSYYTGSNQDLPMSPVGQSSRYLEEKRSAYAAPRQKSKRKVFILAIIAGLILLILAVVIPLYFAVFKPKHGVSGSTGGTSSPGQPGKPTTSGGKPVAALITGGDGSTVTRDDGSTFTYSNKFGGTWYYDPSNPMQNSAQAQSWTPPLNQTFNYGTDRIFGYAICLRTYITPSQL
jgi:glucan 1,3-beta-glucosidase